MPHAPRLASLGWIGGARRSTRDSLDGMRIGIQPESAEERSALDAVLAAIREEWGFAPTYGLDGLLRSWQRCVEELESPEGIETYFLEHAVSLRDELDRVVLQVSPRLASELALGLAPLDQRFMASTKASDTPLLPALDGEVLHERWFREPLA